MRFLKLLTWLNVRRVIREKTHYGSKLPEGIVRIGCFSDALEIGMTNDEDKKKAERALKEWFGNWYKEDEALIQLDMGNAVLPVEFSAGEEKTDSEFFVRPFWEEIAYTGNSADEEKKLPENVKLPEPYPSDSPRLIAFYSFKGGVGRTLQLSAYLFALLERAKQLGDSKTILVIDADMEAPGLTYWNRLEKQQPSVSFIDFLETYHYSPLDNTEETLRLFAKELKKTAKTEGKSTWYFLPACLDDKELLDTPVLPEHLARSSRGAWKCGEAVYYLGRAVGADYVLIDLRAGLSEISSPIIFDPRIQRFIVTTIAEQSVQGTKLVLEHIGKIVPSDESIENEIYYDPSIIISMLKPEFKSLPEFETALIHFQTAYIESDDDNVYSKRLPIWETDFAEELLWINTWEDALLKLKPTSVMKNAKVWAESQIISSVSADKLKPEDRIKDVDKLRKICRQYEYAENGEGKDLLITEPLKNMAKNFQDELPRVISIGSKGAGKTFNYIQLARFQNWDQFLNYILKHTDYPSDSKTLIFPLLQSKKLKDKAKQIINASRNKVKAAFKNSVPDYLPSMTGDRIQKALKNADWNEQEWTAFWIDEIAKSMGMELNMDQRNHFTAINDELITRSLRIIFMLDGLEDIFSEAASNPVQQAAIRSLIYLPDRLSEIRNANLGLIVFLRRDFLRYAVTQNTLQFENLYRAYDLFWDADSFLKLVFWVCSQAKVIGAKEADIYNLSREELITRLEKLWGKKLGSNTSKEAYTRNWVFAALTDFKGRLQARDIVRFLYHASDITIENFKEVQFEKWCTTRLLPPQAIRRALEPCSKKKVEEAKEEYPQFKEWVENTLPDALDKLRIPFTSRDFNIEQPTVRMLEEMGVIYEDKAKDGTTRFYMPEIFRAGLDFSLDKGARPRVLVLKRKALEAGSL